MDFVPRPGATARSAPAWANSPARERNDPALAKSLRVDLGTYNPLLGRAYTEIAAGLGRTQP